MVGLEEKILLTARESDDTRDALAAVRQVVNNCVLDVNVSVDDMTTFDLEWLFLQIRSASISNISKVWLVDPDDGKRYEFEIDLAQVKVVTPEAPEPKIDLGNGVGVSLCWPKGKLYKNETTITEDNAADILLGACIDKVFENDSVMVASEHSYEELAQWVSGFDIQALEKLRAWIQACPHMSYTISYEDKAGKLKTYEMTGLGDFFEFS